MVEDAAPEDDSGAGAPRPSWRDRLSQSFLKPAPPPKAEPNAEEDGRPLTDAEVKAQITRLDPTETKVGNGASVLGVLILVLAIVPYIDNPNTPIKTSVNRVGKSCPTGYKYEAVRNHGYQCVGNLVYPRSTWIWEFIVLMLFPIAIFITVRLSRRAAAGFAGLMTGLAFEFFLHQYSILGLPFLVFGGWLLLRAWRVQRYGTPTARGAAEAASAKRAAKKTGGTVSTPVPKGGPPSRSRTKRAKTETVTATGRVVPAPSKRYTPKAPPRKKPIPPVLGSGPSGRLTPGHTAPRRMDRGVLGHQRRAQQGQHVGPPTDQRPGRRLLARAPGAPRPR